MSVLDSIKKTFSFEDDYEAFQEEVDLAEGPAKVADNVIKPSFFKRRDTDKEKEMDVPRQGHRPLARTDTLMEEGGSALNIVKPERFDDAMTIVEEVRAGRIVVINTNNMDIRTAQRLLDFVSGSTFALQGDIQEVMESIYIASPRGISVKNSARAESAVKSLFSFK